MAKITIHSITCKDQQEETSGNDEIYFYLFDTNNPNASYENPVIEGLHAGKTVFPNAELTFDGSVRFQLWESDGGHNQNEKLGEFTLGDHAQYDDHMTLWSAAYDSNYSINYSVFP